MFEAHPVFLADRADGAERLEVPATRGERLPAA
jgi:hypothetical protein